MQKHYQIRNLAGRLSSNRSNRRLSFPWPEPASAQDERDHHKGNRYPGKDRIIRADADDQKDHAQN